MAFADHPEALPAPQPFAPPVAPAATGLPPAGFWSRFGATIIDGIIITVAGFVPYAIAATAHAAPALVGLTGLWAVFMYVFYAPVMLAFHDGATWGKQACDQRVVINDGRPIGFGRALLREITKLLFGVLSLPYLISGLMVGVRKDKRGLHDLMIGTRVDRTR